MLESAFGQEQTVDEHQRSGKILSSVSQTALQNAPWLIAACLALFMLGLVAQIRRSQADEQKRQTGVAIGRVVGFITANGQTISEPVIFPMSGSSEALIVLYEFQADATSASIRGQDIVAQTDLVSLKIGSVVTVRFNPKLPANSRIGDFRTQAIKIADQRQPGETRTFIRTASHLNWVLGVAMVAAVVAGQFQNPRFVPTTHAAHVAYFLATGCAALALFASYGLPMRIPENQASHFFSRWVLPPLMAFGTFIFVVPFWGNLVPATYTRIAGATGQRQVTVAGYSYDVRSRRNESCTTVAFHDVPAGFVGSDVLCRPRENLPPVNTVVYLNGQVSSMGIIASDVRW